MKKKIISVVWVTLVCLPCILMFTEGGHPILGFCGLGGASFENLFAIVYSAFLLKYSHLLIPKWVQKTVDDMVREDRASNLD